MKAGLKLPDVTFQTRVRDETVGGPNPFRWQTMTTADYFAGKRAVQRHQLVYRTLGPLMQQIHALALHTYTPQEWAATGAAPDSPACRGGSKHDGTAASQ